MGALRRYARRLAALALAGLLSGVLVSAIASHASATASAAAAKPITAAPGECAATVAGAIGEVGENIYRQATTGVDATYAVHLLQSSTALASALESGDSAAARATLSSLLVDQIARVRVLRGSRVFAEAGSGDAMAPIQGLIQGRSGATVGSFVVSVLANSSFVAIAHGITDAQVLVRSPTRQLSGTLSPGPASVPAAGPVTEGAGRLQAVSFAAVAYPVGELRISMLVPFSAIACAATPAQTRADTLGQVGERIYRGEVHSTGVLWTIRYLEHSPAFTRAVAAEDVGATHAAIDGFFRQHIHVVRVRVTIGSRLLIDVGGPYVLAPVHGTLRSDGRVIGHFTVSIQDDVGYLKLAHEFTGAAVLMRTGEHQIMGTLEPGPASVPERGQLAYEGQTYQAYSFAAEAFPSGPLRISLLLAS